MKVGDAEGHFDIAASYHQSLVLWQMVALLFTGGMEITPDSREIR